MKIKDLRKLIKTSSPVRDFFPSIADKLSVRITSEDLFSDVNSQLPSSDVIDYLFSIACRVPIKEELRIVLPSDSDFEKAVKSYKSYIAVELSKSLKELRSLSWKVFMFLAAGAAILTASYFLEHFGNRVLTDSVNIIGGFSIWEAADTFVFARAEKRREVLSLLKLYNAEWCISDDGKHH